MEIFKFKNLISTDDMQRYNNYFNKTNYSAIQFKSEVISHLKQNSKYLINEGKKTIKCQIPNSTFVFDIVCAFEYRLYSYFINLNTNYIEGNIIYDQFDNRIINFPKQSYKNSVAKNKNCDGKYKETVRIIKNIMKNKIIENNWIPSFALESLLYNVSNEYFTYNDKAFRCSKIIEQTKKIINNNWDYLVESNQLLFIKNINNVTQQKCLMLLNEIDTLLSKHIIQDLTNVNNNFKTY